MVPTRFWSYEEAKDFLYKSGYAEVFERLGYEKTDSVNRLARQMAGRVRRRAHGLTLWEKLEDFESLLQEPDTTFGDLRAVVLSG